MTRHKAFLEMAEDIAAGGALPSEGLEEIAALSDNDVFEALAGADLIRNAFFGREIHLCAIHNGKSGRCTEDCSFCSQSMYAKTDIPVYPLQGSHELIARGMRAARTAINRYSVVTSGKGLTPSEVKAVANALSALNGSGIQTCASLGILAEHDMQVLKAAGVGRYHHNLETSESYFRNMCTTHTYEERIRTLYAAKEAGLSVCSGGVFGIGESQEQILELALALRALEVDAVPLNFLVPIKGTRNEACKHLSPLKCLKIIALFRYAVPDKEIIICGGREANLKELHPLVFYAGASGIMTGDYLTTSGIALDRDMQMLDHLGLIPRAKRKDDRGQCITLTPNALTNKDRS